LFSVENAVRDHFAALDDAGVGHVTYKNMEAVAEEQEEEEEEAVIAEVLTHICMHKYFHKAKCNYPSITSD
jgi:hypothetical protein